VLAHKAGGEFKVGQPYLDNVAVEAEILEELRGPKVSPGCCRQKCGVLLIRRGG
jgi:ribosomal protein L21